MMSPALASETVLIVDDKPANLDLLYALLSEHGYKVRTAISGAMALMAAQAAPPDLILLDVTMPEMSGYEVCQRLKADARLCDIPVIFISALAELGNKVTAFEVGAVDYISKPFEIREVLARVQTQLLLHRQHQELNQQRQELAAQNAQLVQTMARLEELDHAKDRFLAYVSHELRTPLNSILGYSEALLMGINGPLEEATREDVEAIHGNGRHLLHLLNNLLDLAKIEAGHLILEPEEISIADLLRQVQTAASGLLYNKPITLLLEIEENLPLLWADRIRLTQILMNLLANAVKFTKEGHIWLRAYQAGKSVVLEVADDGIGMGEADLERIFEAYQQVDASHTRRAQGTGLGLAITRHLINLHGGEIRVRSELGKGSTFSVHLPIQSSQAQEVREG